ncbi:hypothetical protein ASU31_20080 [Pedobacter ginsenosidimutans]|uniref:Outer membrane protein beta-barrel domain-containing protein n=1 Tax=Pedobacter ginsenosidimutans TaxID=687842 RepID=A0A0T5VKD8_9SPHI|nr:hypothetical protein [Pedobacter ginsenosidimutans]KRT14311.1 hypothetical protein ASU31_20080 [Pedobacter ginsenosidimutans]
MYKISTKSPVKHSILLLVFITLSGLSTKAQQTGQNHAYPKVTGYFSLLHPIGSWDKNGFHDNFSDVYTLVFPFGMNILKSDKFGVSLEIAPSIRTEHNISKVSSVLFHPGAMFRFKHGFTFIGRAAFETNGRYGFTPVLNQVVKKGKDVSLYLALPFPVRFGNNLPASLSTGLQVGVSF